MSDTELSLNVAARKARHKRVFAGTGVLTRFIPLFGFGSVREKDSNDLRSSCVKRTSGPSASSKLLRSYSIAVLATLIIGSVNPDSAYSYNSIYTPELTDLEGMYLGENMMLASEDGYIPKINPQTEFSDRTTMNDRIIHSVVAGETISKIAQEYGLKMNTVLWENGLTTSSTLKVGQKLIIPPVDGVSHTVEKGQDIKKIAAAYNVDAPAIIRQNRLEEGAALKTGDSIFIPGAKPLPVVNVNRNNPARVASSGRVGKNIGSTKLVAGSQIGADSSSKPISGKLMIFPTRGKITQGYKPGHYAIDIADVSKPPVWAAMDGTVVTASSGTWGGGYGNHIIVDHGNGLRTLYAHLENLSVSVGDKVVQGQVIGKMGRTGNVRGRTGIHLHFEVVLNGQKKSPNGYF